MRALFLLLSLSLSACADPGPAAPEASGADTLAFDLDSLIQAEISRQDAKRLQRESDRTSAVRRQRRDLMWTYARDGDWSDAPDSLLVEMLHIGLGGGGRYQKAHGERSAPIALSRPLAEYARGLPRPLDPYAHGMDSLARAHGIADRVLVQSRTDTLYKGVSFAGFDLYHLATTTEVRLQNAPPEDSTPDRDEGPRETVALLAVRGGNAEPILISRSNWAGISAETESTPEGPVLAVAVQHWGARTPSVYYVERRGGSWATLARAWELGHGSIPFMADMHYTDFDVDLSDMEVRSSLVTPDGNAGCFATEILREGGRFTTGSATWHREVESCYEYTFERLPPRVRVDTTLLGAEAGQKLRMTLQHRASSDTTTRYEWRLLNPAGRSEWQGMIPAGVPRDSTYTFARERAISGVWTLLQIRREDTPAYGQTFRPPKVSMSTSGFTR